MGDVHIDHHAAATSVTLVEWRGDVWLWFDVEQGHLVQAFITSHELEGVLQDGSSGDQAKSYLESRMQAAGYRLRPTAIQNDDLAVWEIAR